MLRHYHGARLTQELLQILSDCWVKGLRLRCKLFKQVRRSSDYYVWLQARDGRETGMFEQRTKDVIVRVEPDYLEDQSSPDESRFIWAYTVEIENQGETDLRVVDRFWQIADSRGQVQEVRGRGVVGEQPVVRPGETFRYTSGAPLSAPSARGQDDGSSRQTP